MMMSLCAKSMTKSKTSYQESNCFCYIQRLNRMQAVVVFPPHRLHFDC